MAERLTIMGNVPSKSVWNKKVSDETIISEYNRLGNVWHVGESVGICGQSVHIRLTKLGLIKRMNYFTKADEKFLIKNYVQFRDDYRLQELADIMGRTKSFICREARKLGLTTTETKWPERKKEILSKAAEKRIKDYGHPKGMLGKLHSDEFKVGASIRARKNWANPSSKFNSERFRQIQSDNMSKRQAEGKLLNNYSRCKSGTVSIGGKDNFFRSSWECNVAAYFEFLKANKEILEWEYEPTVFWFEKIKRGVRSYKPDFRITEKNGNQYYVEVKGWMDNKSKTKLNRMRIYYPKVKIDLIDERRYKAIKSKSSFIPNWGSLENGLVNDFKRCSIDGCENKSFSKNVCRKHHYKLFKK